MIGVINNISVFAVPCMIFVFLSVGCARKVPVYEEFLSGAEDGLKVVLRIFPILLAILVAVAMLRQSGLLNVIVSIVEPVTKRLNIPSEIVPLALLRPVSGGGSIGLLTELLNTYGADSIIGRIGSVMAGSTETTFYTLAVYYSVTKVKNTRCSLMAALIGDFVGLMGSVYICNLFF